MNPTTNPSVAMVKTVLWLLGENGMMMTVIWPSGGLAKKQYNSDMNARAGSFLFLQKSLEDPAVLCPNTSLHTLHLECIYPALVWIKVSAKCRNGNDTIVHALYSTCHLKQCVVHIDVMCTNYEIKTHCTSCKFKNVKKT